MHDPIGTHQRLVDEFISYVETAFRIQDPDVAEAREALLRKDKSIQRPPSIEPIPRYQAVSWTWETMPSETLPGFSVEAREAFLSLVRGGLMKGVPSPYTHQGKALARGVTAGHPVVVTSGTGSGKTETFMLPILAELARQGVKWSRPNPDYLEHRWWERDRSDFSPRRLQETRPAAVRAIILYPMNALVEDQLTRIRQALDSDEVRGAMDLHFHGNRIFFGRYTGESAPTGFSVHPRPFVDEARKRKEKQRRDSKKKHLKRLLREYADTQAFIDSEMAGGNAEHWGKDRFLFPRVDGGELISRWDMQATPPDVLVTNVSMLSGMLAREVEEPIFETTRKWLEEDEEACFFLVLDELHLYRGTSGTEVAYLLRTLLHRLGLADPGRRHKLRILASSASLPEDDPKSHEFLWDFFGRNGTFADAQADGFGAALDWKATLVTGDPLLPRRQFEGILPTAPFEKVVHVFQETSVQGVLRCPVQVDELTSRQCEALNDTAAAFNLSTTVPLGVLVSNLVQESAAQLWFHCLPAGQNSRRATQIGPLAHRIFGDPSHLNALRGLLFLRSLGDTKGGSAAGAPAFRVHHFFKSIQGLFVTPSLGQGGKVVFGNLNLDGQEGAGSRVYEMLYCEACGDLFLGGSRGKGPGDSFVLLQGQEDLDGLPESGGSLLFENQCYDRYALFWPSPVAERPEKGDWEPADDRINGWMRCELHPKTGEVRPVGRARASRPDSIPGWTYLRSAAARDEAQPEPRKNDDPGSHLPFACPNCRLDYSHRKTRLSPIRHFRTGFGKIAQVLTDEFFSGLRLTGEDATRLIVFADSRSEAASNATTLQKEHFLDARRALVMTLLRDLEATRNQISESVRQEIANIDTRLTDPQLAARERLQLNQRRAEKEVALFDLQAEEIPICSLLPDPDGTDYEEGRPLVCPPGPLLDRILAMGSHPWDPAGVAHVRHDGVEVEWTSLFIQDGPGHFRWNPTPKSVEDDDINLNMVNALRRSLLKEVEETIGNALFSRNFYAAEEMGLGTITSGPFDPGMAAFLRVLADAWRVRGSEFGDQGIRPWNAPGEISARNRIWKYAGALCAGDRNEMVAWLQSRMDELRLAHAGLILRPSHLFVKLAKGEDPAWRCRCGRVALHRGSGLCTRCLSPLDDTAILTVDDVRRSNALWRRYQKALGKPFRLNSEELSGQTDDGPDRQRRFRGVFIGELSDLERSAQSIDLLSVTTTMEVGIDVGPLQGVVQANMPPQRYNYQQRVGRAGRRGQAFAYALTICRNRSHDLHYFEAVDEITGNPPPVPFLSKTEPSIPRRMVDKSWILKTFRSIREVWPKNNDDNRWPHDGLRPPDIHGELLPAELDVLERIDAQADIDSHLRAHRVEMKALAQFLLEGVEIPLDQILSGEQDLRQMLQSACQHPNRRAGVAQTLAELGHFPMYGMPTRVRNFVHDVRKNKDGDANGEWGLQQVDRDVEQAIHEFAPQRLLEKDKRLFEAKGFCAPPISVGERNGRLHLDTIGSAFVELGSFGQCRECGAWGECPGAEGAEHLCENCQAPILSWSRAIEPGAFFGDFAGMATEESKPMSFRQQVQYIICGNPGLEEGTGVNLRAGLQSQTPVVKTNRGPRGRGFDLGPIGQGSMVARNRRPWVNVPGFYEASAAEGPADGVWLGARKTTDALAFGPASLPAGLDLSTVPFPSGNGVANVLRVMRATATRAAIHSAATLLLDAACQELDVDQAEFETFTPQMVDGLPVLFIADALPNGSGLVRRIHATGLLERCIDQILDPGGVVMQRLIAHRDVCRTACYGCGCLKRYGNQRFHGLLDWRLGLSYLRLLKDPTFDAGHGGDFSAPELDDWKDLVLRQIDALRSVGHAIEPVDGIIPTFDFDGRRFVVHHPFWKGPENVTEVPPPIVIDSFNWERRAVQFLYDVEAG